MPRAGRVPPAGIAVTLCLFLLAAPAWAHQGQPPSNEDCLACHADASLVRSNGTTVFVDVAVIGASTHAGLACVNCHVDLEQAELPHPERLAAPSCAACHSDATAAYDVGVHAVARRAGGTAAARCADCHGAHDIRQSRDTASRTYRLNLPNTCGRCHGDPRIISENHIEAGNVFEQYQDSIHGQILVRSGLIVAPTCSDCHRAHDIRPRSSPESTVHRTAVSATCGTCHEGLARQFDASVHGVHLTRGNVRAPACQDCHTAHSIQRADVPAWQLGVIRECGSCHTESMKTYRDTFHGQVTTLGFVRVAACADCHGAHEIFPKEDPRSHVSPARLVETCRRCHENANENFVQYDPHADKENRDRNPGLYYTAWFMKGLLFSVFAFFGLHTALWARRTARTWPGGRASPPTDTDKQGRGEA